MAILYCECGNSFRVGKFYGKPTHDKCPLCGKRASNTRSLDSLRRGSGTVIYAFQGVYHYPNCNGSGGKIPKQRTE